LYDAEAFQEAIHRETARSLRSGRPLPLVLIDVSGYGSGGRLAAVLSSSTREIDIKGWYAEGAVPGLLCTEFGSMRDSVDAARKTIVGRLYDSLSGLLGDEAIRITPYTLQAGRTRFEASSSRLRSSMVERERMLFLRSTAKPARREGTPNKKLTAP